MLGDMLGKLQVPKRNTHCVEHKDNTIYMINSSALINQIQLLNNIFNCGKNRSRKDYSFRIWYLYREIRCPRLNLFSLHHPTF